MNLDAAYWTNRYEKQETGWDTGSITPPLKEYFETITDKNAAILIPGCGNAHEAAWLLDNGFTNISLLDISSLLCNQLTQKFSNYDNQSYQIICADFFEHEGQYDYIIEQTFFCALNPTMRTAYVEHMQKLLKPGGKLAGLLFNREFEGGPPFGGSESEYRSLFSNSFHIQQMQPATNSIAPRNGAEVFFELELLNA